MKKHDIIIIGLSMLMIILFLIIFLGLKNDKSDVIEVCYKNEVIYQTTMKSEMHVIIEINAGENKIIITQDEEKVINYSFDEDFHNAIEINDGIVKMISASCKNKYCMSMRLTEKINAPIICTNGICVRYGSEDLKIYV